MNELMIKRPKDTTATLIPNEFLDKYMPRASGEFVKVYLYFLRYALCLDSGVSLATAADTFCMTENDILRALKYWEKEGLLRLYMENGSLTGIELCAISAGNVAEVKTAAATLANAAAQQAATAAPTYAAAQQAASAQAYATAQRVAAAAPTYAAAQQAATATLANAAAQQAAAAAPTYAAAQQAASAQAYAGGQKNTPNMYNGVPAYTMEDIQNFRKYNDGEQLFFVIQQYLGKPLGPTDINTIVYFSEQLHFPSDLIEYLFEYCVSNNHYSIHYIEKTALGWASEGIDTVAKARSHCTYYNKTSFDILKAFGITNRNPAKGELEYIRRWTREYGFPLPIILEACRRTIEATHAPNFAYAESILKKWYEKNVGSMDDIKKLDLEHDKKRQEAAQTESGNPTYVNSFAKKGTPAPGKQKARSNKFHNFEQRTYDYSELEQTLLNKARKQAEAPTGGK